MTENNQYLIGICATSLHQARFSDLLDCLKKEAPRFHCKLLVFACAWELSEHDEHDQGQKSIFQIIPYHMLDALLILTESIKDKEIPRSIARKARERNIPVFSLDEELEGCYNIQYGYSEAFSALIRHVIEVHGCRTINLMAGLKGTPFEQERTRIYREVLTEYNIPVEEERIYYGDFWEFPTNRAIDTMMRSNQSFPDAIVCQNDAMAIATCNHLSHYGYSVPEDVIITGLDGIIEGQNFSPAITTASQDHIGTALAFFSMFQRILNGESPKKNVTIPFRPRWEQSCGCIPKMIQETNTVMLKLQETIAGNHEYNVMMDRLRHSLIRLPYRELLPKLEPYLYYTSWICLRTDYNTMEGDEIFGSYEENRPAFTEQMNAVLSRHTSDYTYNTFFALEDLLPDLISYPYDDPGFLFLPIHFQKKVFGYFAISLDMHHLNFEMVSQFCDTLGTILQVVQEQERVHILLRQLDATNHQLTNLYNLDPLTGLLNRRGFQAEIDRAQTENSIQHSQLVLISIDMDGLKKINDTYGHKDGDYSLCLIADCMKHIARKYEGTICARFGGDEFLMAGFYSPLLNVTNGILDTFQEQMDFLNSMSGKEYTVTASIGYLSLIPEPGFDIESLINEADTLMYKNKKARKQERK